MPLQMGNSQHWLASVSSTAKVRNVHLSLPLSAQPLGRGGAGPPAPPGGRGALPHAYCLARGQAAISLLRPWGPGYSRRSWAFQGTCTKGRLRRPPVPAHWGSAPGLPAKSAWARGRSGQPGVLCANHILIPEPPPQANRDSRHILQARAWTHVPAAARKEPQIETLTGLTQCLVWEGGIVVHFLPNILFSKFQA